MKILLLTAAFVALFMTGGPLGLLLGLFALYCDFHKPKRR